MPLGGFSDFPYQQEELELYTGDTGILMSDGLPEMFNERMESLEYRRVKEILRNIDHQSPQEIIDRLVQAGESWASGRPQDDDVTLVVVQVKA